MATWGWQVTVIATEPDWYAAGDMLPPLGVRVRVMWDGRVFEASRVRHPESGRLKWVVLDRRRGAVYLPLEVRRAHDPARPWDGWHTLPGSGPDYWQPLVARGWQQPLPVARRFPTVSGRMWSSTTRFSAVAEAEAAELWREMERRRGVAEAEPGGGSRRGQWWRDPNAVIYEPEGHVSREMAEARVMRAALWCGAGLGLTLRAQTPLSVLSAIVSELAEDEAPTRVRLKPLPQDHADFDTAMGWFVQLNPPESWHKRREAWSLSRAQRVIVLRASAPPWSYADIADECGWRHGEQARQGYLQAIDACWRAANGGIVDPTVPTPEARVAALRARNRAARRAS